VNLEYAISGEEHRPLDLVRHAQRAEQAGFPYALISVQAFLESDGEGPRYGQVTVCWADEGIREFVAAGFDHVYVHQVGPDQEGFLDFYEREILPAAESLKVGSPAEEVRA